jgi:dihydropteroate synthase
LNTADEQLVWSAGCRRWVLGHRPLVMGVLNVTPDSFSDGGRYFDHRRAVLHGLRMVEAGADLVDVGGESTRPGARPVEAEEERRRVVPVVAALREQTETAISIDTRKAAVAREALQAGADVLNDISAFRNDPGMTGLAVASDCGVVLMHMQGTPERMQDDPRYGDPVRDIAAFLGRQMDRLIRAGISAERIAVDPGIGFGKRLEHNLALLARLPELAALGRPVLVGLSRKSFLGRLTGREVGGRLAGSLGALAYAVLHGAHIVRVHDVEETCDVVEVLAKLRREEPA